MILYILLAAILILVIGPAIFADRTPIPETSSNVHKITKSIELDMVLSSNKRVVVDFYADWCPPCRLIAPIFSKLADDHALKERLAFAKVNTDHVKDLAGRYSISAMPTFLFFENGKPTSVKITKNVPSKNPSSSKGDTIDRVLGADAALLRKAVQSMAMEA